MKIFILSISNDIKAVSTDLNDVKTTLLELNVNNNIVLDVWENNENTFNICDKSAILGLPIE